MDAPLIQLQGAALAPTATGEVPLRDISWSVQRGEWWVITGPPSCGKSALLQTLGVLHPVSQGELRLFGRTISSTMGDDLATIRRGIGLLFEGGGHLFEHSTVLENVALPLRYHHDLSLEDAAEQVRPTLEACGLEAIAGQSLRHVSRALRRRIALARTLALRPEIMLLDNPAGGLDPAQLRWWRGFLSQLHAGHPLFDQQPMTLVLATDDLRPWLPFGQQFAVVRDQTLTPLGNREELHGRHAGLLAQLLAEDIR